jgi:hypothetical protein
MFNDRTLCTAAVRERISSIANGLSHIARRMHISTILDYKKAFLCVLREFEISKRPRSAVLVREWHPIHRAEEAGVRTLVGRPVTEVNSDEGIYVDEEGNVFQLAEKGKSKPMEVEKSVSEREAAGADAQTSTNGGAQKESKPSAGAATDNHRDKVVRERIPKRKAKHRPSRPNLPMASASTSKMEQQKKLRLSQRRCLRS